MSRELNFGQIFKCLVLKCLNEHFLFIKNGHLFLDGVSWTKKGGNLLIFLKIGKIVFSRDFSCFLGHIFHTFNSYICFRIDIGGGGYGRRGLYSPNLWIHISN